MDVCGKDKDAKKMPVSILVVLIRHYKYCLWQSPQSTNAKACVCKGCQLICMEISV